MSIGYSLGKSSVRTENQADGFFHRLIRSAAFPILIVIVLAFFAQKLIGG